VFLRWPRTNAGLGLNPDGWLYRTAANLGVDELRKRARRSKFDWLFGRTQQPATPEEIHGVNQERDRVRHVLSRMQPRQAELLVLRTQGFSYEELASALGLNLRRSANSSAGLNSSFERSTSPSMDISNDRLQETNVEDWVQRKLSALTAPLEWQPKTDVGLALLRRGARSRTGWRRTGVYAAAC
jgi:hypothetical protein